MKLELIEVLFLPNLKGFFIGWWPAVQCRSQLTNKNTGKLATTISLNQSHYIGVAQGDILMEQKMRFGLVLGWLAIMKINWGRL